MLLPLRLGGRAVGSGAEDAAPRPPEETGAKCDFGIGTGRELTPDELASVAGGVEQPDKEGTPPPHEHQ